MRKFRGIEYTCNFCGAPVDCSFAINDGLLTIYVRQHQCPAQEVGLMENELTDMLERVIDEVGRIEPDYKLLEVARELLAKAKAALGGE